MSWRCPLHLCPTSRCRAVCSNISDCASTASSAPCVLIACFSESLVCTGAVGRRRWSAPLVGAGVDMSIPTLLLNTATLSDSNEGDETSDDGSSRDARQTGRRRPNCSKMTMFATGYRGSEFLVGDIFQLQNVSRADVQKADAQGKKAVVCPTLVAALHRIAFSRALTPCLPILPSPYRPRPPRPASPSCRSPRSPASLLAPSPPLPLLQCQQQPPMPPPPMAAPRPVDLTCLDLVDGGGWVLYCSFLLQLG